MAKPHVNYEVVRDVPGYPFDPCGYQSSSLRDAQKELRQVRRHYPEAYLARVEYSRYPNKTSKKGG